MELIYTDEAGIDRGMLLTASGDFAVGEENTWSLNIPDPAPISDGCYVYIDGTEFGGVVDNIETDTGAGYSTYSGRTLQGILATNIVCPPAGADYLELSGEANACIAAVLAAVGLGAPFEADAGDSGIAVGHRFDRFCDAYNGLRAMLAASGARLRIRFRSARVMLSAERIRDLTGFDSALHRMTVKRERAYNHLVCLGAGELRDRAVVHLYADDEGNVSREQSIFGAAHMAKVYDYSNAAEDELVESGTKELESLQTSDSVDLVDELAGDYEIGDVAGARYEPTGATVTEEVSGKIARVSGRTCTIEYKTGETQPSGAVSGASESSGSGGVVYAAGDGIDITGRTISAEVTEDDLRDVEEAAEGARVAASDASAAAGAAQLAAEAAQETADGKAPLSHGHIVGDIADFPESMPASDVAEWAKQPDKPAYTAAEVGAAPSGHSHGTATATTAGFMPILGGDTANYLRADGTWAKPPGTTYSTMKPATASAAGASGLVPAPGAGKQESFLRGDGSWSVPENTEYQPATQAADGLMSAADKKKLDGIEAGASRTVVDAELSSDSANPVQNKAVKTALDGKAPLSHTHPYAGSASPGGPAASTLKLDTARRINFAGSATGSVLFDGSKDVTVTLQGDTEGAGFLAAHPVGSYFMTSSPENPGATYGGTWKAAPSTGPHIWHREA